MPAAQPESSEWSFPNRATPFGSPAYYAVRFSPPAQRERDARLLAWHRLIREIAERPHDPGVARLKLDWWRQEVAALGRHTARHPLAAELQQLDNIAVAQPVMQQIIDRAESAILLPQVIDDRTFLSACRDDLGGLCLLVALVDRGTAIDETACMTAGAYCSAVERIRRVAAAPHGVPPDLAPPALSHMSHAQRIDRFETLLRQLELDARRMMPQIPGMPRRLTALAAAMHNKIRRRGYPVDHTLIDRPPIAHLWTAWRCR